MTDLEKLKDYLTFNEYEALTAAMTVFDGPPSKIEFDDDVCCRDWKVRVRYENHPDIKRRFLQVGYELEFHLALKLPDVVITIRRPTPEILKVIGRKVPSRLSPKAA